MTENDFEDFRSLLQGVYDFYSKDLSRFALDVWWNALKAFDMRTLRGAFSAHCTNPDTGQFCPKPADVIRMVGGTSKDAALVAWNKVREGIWRAGGHQSVCFDDPIINRVLYDMGGWPALCARDEADLPFVERNFCDRYRAYCLRRGALDQWPPYLVGISESNNRNSGFAVEPPLLLGNPAEAAKVLGGGADRPMLQATRAGNIAGLLPERAA